MAPLFENAAIEPCLLHGDLWSGNISSDKNGEPVILDPACYCMSLLLLLFIEVDCPLKSEQISFCATDGHNEAEFGMSWCAGFSSAFYDAYFEVSEFDLENMLALYTLDRDGLMDGHSLLFVFEGDS